MTELVFHVERARPVEYSATPELAFTVGIATAAGRRVESVLLRCSVRIEAGRRPHDEHERVRLRELFGSESVWARASKSLLWVQSTTLVPAFDGSTSVDVKVPCTFDFAASASRYFHSLETGEVPITLQFSGTVFHREGDCVKVAQIPWDREAPFRVPVALFQRIIDSHFPNSAVLGVRRDLFERLHGYRREHGLRSTDDALERLLQGAKELPS